MALGRRHDRLGARIGHPHRPVQAPRRNGDERLDRQIELGAEAAADGGREDPHVLRRDAEDFRDVVAVHIGRLGAGLDFDALAHAAREAGLRFDIGVLDEAGLEFALDHDIGGRETRLDIAARDAPARQDIAGPAGMNALRVGRQRGFHARQRRQGPPRDGKTGEIERARRIVLADDQSDRFAAKPRDALRERRLVGEGADDAETIDAGDVLGGEYGDDAGMGAPIAVEVAEFEMGVCMRRTDRARGQSVRRPFVRAEDLRAREFSRAVETRKTAAHCGRLGRFGRERRLGVDGVAYGVENRAVAGATAEHAAERVLDLGVIRSRGAPKAITTNKSTDEHSLYSPDGRYIANVSGCRPARARWPA